MEQRISLITLGVADVARATAFYKRMGWKPAESPPEITFFQAGGSIFSLYGREALAVDAGVATETSDKSASVVLAFNARSKEEVDAVLAEARDAGAEITKPAEDTFWGGYSGCFADPDGHLWEIAWNPHFAILENGSIRLPE
ncbi:MAG: VOC family protein [Rhodospirillales bacterium]|jgi:uncharacterized protein|nr:VOC family protein [Rhodospirillales bacterium]